MDQAVLFLEKEIDVDIKAGTVNTVYLTVWDEKLGWTLPVFPTNSLNDFTLERILNMIIPDWFRVKPDNVLMKILDCEDIIDENSDTFIRKQYYTYAKYIKYPRELENNLEYEFSPSWRVKWLTFEQICHTQNLDSHMLKALEKWEHQRSKNKSIEAEVRQIIADQQDAVNVGAIIAVTQLLGRRQIEVGHAAAILNIPADLLDDFWGKNYFDNELSTTYMLDIKKLLDYIKHEGDIHPFTIPPIDSLTEN